MSTILVGGSRNFEDYDKFVVDLEEFMKEFDSPTIITGGARGADQMAIRFAKERNIPFRVVKPDWYNNGKKAGILRSIEMVDQADAVVLFWDGISKGTEFTYKYSKLKKVPYIVVKLFGEQSVNFF